MNDAPIPSTGAAPSTGGATPTIGVLDTVAAALPSLAEALGASGSRWHRVARTATETDRCSVLIIGGEDFTADDLRRFPALQLLVRAGIGLDRIDVAACAERDVQVRNTPGYGTEEVADHALLLMLALNRQLGHFQRAAHGTRWDRVETPPVRRLADATLGLIGVGAIGRAMARRGQALGMRVLGTDPQLTADSAAELGIASVGLTELLAGSDVISLHVPLTEDTRDLLDARAFQAMDRQPIVINTARGGLINTAALLEALDRGQLTGAGLDVLDDEPAPDLGPLDRPDVIVTPHVGWYSGGSRTEMGRRAARAASSFLERGTTR